MSQDVFIRKGQIEDAPAIAQLMRGLGYNYSAAEIARRWSLAENPSLNPVFTAVRGDHYVGVIALHIAPLLFYPQPLARITTLVVNHQNRRRGIGRALVEKAVQVSRAAGCDTIELTSGLHRTDAHAFYESLGFMNLAIRMECPIAAS